VHYLAGGVRSASVAYAPSGAPTYEVVFADGSLYQYDATGLHYLAGGVQSAAAAYTIYGQLTYEVCFMDGSLYQYDGAGAHLVGSGVRSASLSNAYFSPSPYWWWTSAPASSAASAPATTATAPLTAAVPTKVAVRDGWTGMRSKGVVRRPGLAAAAEAWRSRPAASGSARKPAWATSSIRG
jgi:hypothetical protein